MTAKEISIKERIGGGYNDFWNTKKRYRVCKGTIPLSFIQNAEISRLKLKITVGRKIKMASQQISLTMNFHMAWIPCGTVLLKHYCRIYTVGSDVMKNMHGDVPKTKYEYLTIDGNWTNHPVAFCWYKKGVLTRGLMHTHKCCDKQCKRLDKNYKFE